MKRVLLLTINFYSYMTKTWCVGGRHISNTNIIVEYGKVNPRNRKLIKIIKGTCSIYGRNISQYYTK